MVFGIWYSYLFIFWFPNTIRTTGCPSHTELFNCDCRQFDAHLGTGPDIPDGPPGHVLVQGLNKVTHDRPELTKVVGLDSPDLLVTDDPEEVVTWGLVRATCWPFDLCVARDNSRPGRQCQNNGQLLPDPVE